MENKHFEDVIDLIFTLSRVSVALCLPCTVTVLRNCDCDCREIKTA